MENPRILLVSILIAASALFLAVSCDQNTVIPANPEPKTGPSLAAEATAEKGKCEARWYDTFSDNEKCYLLQRQLNEAAAAGDLGGISRALAAGAHLEAGYDSSFRPLYTASMAGKENAVRLLLDLGAEVNNVETFGKTPLQAAIFYGHPEIVRLLLKRGADICQAEEDDHGRKVSALDTALAAGKRDAVNILRSSGADDCP